MEVFKIPEKGKKIPESANKPKLNKPYPGPPESLQTV